MWSIRPFDIRLLLWSRVTKPVSTAILSLSWLGGCLWKNVTGALNKAELGELANSLWACNIRYSLSTNIMDRVTTYFPTLKVTADLMVNRHSHVEWSGDFFIRVLARRHVCTVIGWWLVLSFCNTVVYCLFILKSNYWTVFCTAIILINFISRISSLSH